MMNIAFPIGSTALLLLLVYSTLARAALRGTDITPIADPPTPTANVVRIHTIQLEVGCGGVDFHLGKDDAAFFSQAMQKSNQETAGVIQLSDIRFVKYLRPYIPPWDPTRGRAGIRTIDTKGLFQAVWVQHASSTKDLFPGGRLYTKNASYTQWTDNFQSKIRVGPEECSSFMLAWACKFKFTASPFNTTTIVTTKAPTTMAPVTSAPITVAPVTSAPITVAPVTSAPATVAPVTNAPAPSPKATNYTRVHKVEISVMCKGVSFDSFLSLTNQVVSAKAMQDANQEAAGAVVVKHVTFLRPETISTRAVFGGVWEEQKMLEENLFPKSGGPVRDDPKKLYFGTWSKLFVKKLLESKNGHFANVGSCSFKVEVTKSP